MAKKTRRQNDRIFFTRVVLVLAGVFLIFFISLSLSRMDFVFPRVISDFSGGLFKNKFKDIKKFSSEDDFKNYLAASLNQTASYGGLGRGGAMMNREIAPMDMKSANGIGGGAAERVSETNVQVAGIDEPDIVKTDGEEIYFSPSQIFRIWDGRMRILSEEKIQEAIVRKVETKIIKAFPPADLALDGKIDKQGDLLLDKNNLIVFSTSGYYGSQPASPELQPVSPPASPNQGKSLGGRGEQEILGYNVSNPKSPTKKWTIKLDNNTSVVTSRLRDGKIYLITRNNINTPQPCPLKPLLIDGVELNIKCADIYHPIVPAPADTTFIAMVLNPDTGKIEKTVSFVGSSGSSVIYVSENAIYATYIYNESIAKSLSGFIKENNDLFPSWLAEKATKLESYDISENSKLQEITALIEKYNNSLSNDERLKMENEMTNRMKDYYKKRRRDIEKTGIFKVDLNKFQITASGTIPGRLLNNFAMDEYQNNLRVATTIGGQWGIFGGLSGSGTANDVYVLDKNLKTIGSVKDLGETEQIYSVRFIEDKGYVVTFRQTDPFYILDLSNPANPEMTGELKIPGYSSYLHPLDATHILGIGMEGSKVKISLFDVSDKNNPAELDKYMLDEYWSEVANNYHAFLLDKKHNIFFLPGSKGGYVFSYFSRPECPALQKCLSSAEYRLNLKKAISQNSVKRAIYINDYLYIIGDDKITVLNELDWQKVNELKF